MFHCLVIKVVYLSLSVRQLVYINTTVFVCQQLFLIFLKLFQFVSKRNPASSEARFSISSESGFVNPFFQFFYFFAFFDISGSITVKNAHEYLNKNVLAIQEIKECILLDQCHSLLSKCCIAQ